MDGTRECRHCGAELYRAELCEDAAACEDRAADTEPVDDDEFVGPDDDDYTPADLDYFADRAADRYERAFYGA